MNKCLLTKLNKKIENSNLSKFGDLILLYPSGSHGFYFRGEKAKLYNDAGDATIWRTNGEILGNEINSPNELSVLRFSGSTDMTLTISNKYFGFNNYSTGTNNTTNVEYFQYCTNLYGLALMNNTSTGNFECLTSLFLTECNFVNSLITGNANKWCEKLYANGKNTETIILRCSGYMTYTNQVGETITPDKGKVLYLVFKQNGYEIREDSETGNILYDSAA